MIDFNNSIDKALKSFKYRDLGESGFSIKPPTHNNDLDFSPPANNLPPINQNKPRGNFNINPEVIKNILIAIIVIAIIVMIIYFCVKFYQKYKNNKKLSETTPSLLRDIVDNNLSEEKVVTLLKKYENELDFKNAVRYLFIFLILKLQQNNYFTNFSTIKTKTTHDLYFELQNQNQSLANTFLTIMLAFNFVWFGDKKIDLATYKKYKLKVENILLNIKPLNVSEFSDIEPLQGGENL